MNRAGRQKFQHSWEKTASGSGKEERAACLQEQVGRVWAKYESPVCSQMLQLLWEHCGGGLVLGFFVARATSR